MSRRWTSDILCTTIPLGEGREAYVETPQRLTVAEAERIAAVVRALAFPDDAEGAAHV